MFANCGDRHQFFNIFFFGIFLKRSFAMLSLADMTSLFLIGARTLLQTLATNQPELAPIATRIRSVQGSFFRPGASAAGTVIGRVGRSWPLFLYSNAFSLIHRPCCKSTCR